MFDLSFFKKGYEKDTEEAKDYFDRRKEYYASYKDDSLLKKLQKLGVSFTKDENSNDVGTYGGTFSGELYGIEDYTGGNETKSPNAYGSGGYKSIHEGIKKTSQYDEIIKRVGLEENVNPMFIKVTIIMETRGNAESVGDHGSGAKSIGLTQITPGQVGISVDESKLKDPEYNIKMFCKAIKEEKIKNMRAKNYPENVYHGFWYWNQVNEKGKKYAEAACEIYEGFGHGLRRDDPIVGTTAGVRETGGSAKASAIIETAKSFLGKITYVFGATDIRAGGTGDCSAFTGYCFKQHGVTLPRTSKEQASSSTKYSDKGSIVPGDLVFFATGSSATTISHVGILMGGDEFIHLSGQGVNIAKLTNSYWKPKIIQYGRVLPKDESGGGKVSSIVISSGHGQYVRGASGVLDEVDEARRVVNRVAEILNGKGISTKVIHDNSSRSQSDNLNYLVASHNGYSRQLDVSIHFNANTTTNNPMGSEVLYKTTAAQTYATSVGNELGKIFKQRPNKVRTDLRFLNGCEKNPILIEVCFVDSKKDAEIYQSKFEEVCQAIARGLSS